MNKEIKMLIKDLEKNIDNYCGDYGTLEHRLEETLEKILNILKIINGEKIENVYSEFFIERLKENSDE